MVPIKFNDKLREICTILLNEGFTNYDLVSLTLGPSKSVQMKKFLEGRDFGLKPLENFFDGLGYDLMIVPFRRDMRNDIFDESGFIEEIELHVQEKLEEIHEILIKYLEDFKMVESKKQSTRFIIEDEIDKLIEELKDS